MYYIEHNEFGRSKKKHTKMEKKLLTKTHLVRLTEYKRMIKREKERKRKKKQSIAKKYQVSFAK